MMLRYSTFLLFWKIANDHHHNNIAVDWNISLIDAWILLVFLVKYTLLSMSRK